MAAYYSQAVDGPLDPNRAMLESLIGIRRAGADFIVTYFAKDAAKLLRKSRKPTPQSSIAKWPLPHSPWQRVPELWK